MSQAEAKQQPQDALPRREEFQKYLEKEGVIEELTKLFVYLYESDRPDNALDYIRQFFTQSQSNENADSKLAGEVEELQRKLAEKDAEIAKLRAQLASKSEANEQDGDGAKKDVQES